MSTLEKTNKTNVKVSYQTQKMKFKVNVNGNMEEFWADINVPIIEQYIDNSCPLDGPINIQYRSIQPTSQQMVYPQYIPYNPYMGFNQNVYQSYNNLSQQKNNTDNQTPEKRNISINVKKSEELLSAIRHVSKEIESEDDVKSILSNASDKNDTTDEVDTADEIEQNASALVKSNNLSETDQKRKIKFSELFKNFKDSPSTIPNNKGNIVKKTSKKDKVVENDDNYGENPFITQNDTEEDSGENDKVRNDYYFLLEQLENIIKKFVDNKIFPKINITEELSEENLKMLNFYRSVKGSQILQNIDLMPLEDRIRDIIDEKYFDNDVNVTFNAFPNPIVHKKTGFRINMKKTPEMLQKETDEFINIIISQIPQYIENCYDKDKDIFLKFYVKNFFTQDELEYYRPYLTNKKTKDKFFDKFEELYRDAKFDFVLQHSFDSAYFIAKSN